MRPLFFDWPADLEVWTAPTQWMLGADLLVAPVLEEGSERGRVYLPEGEWIDVWTGESTRGGRSIEVETPIEQIPVFARDRASSELLAPFRADG
jgi:alpha-glucosidase (family GH31 glycosyl hydrolase)